MSTLRQESRGKSRPDPALMRDAEEALAQVRTLWRDLFRNPLAEAAESGLTGPQVTVMTALVTRGPMTLTELSGTLAMTHSTASGIVDRLQARGLLRRSPDVADRRRTRISVTDKVTRYVGELEAGPSGRLAAALARATPAERRAIKNGLSRLCGLLRLPDATSGS